jgi:UDP-N-acetylmuramate dehydrogenase
VRVRRFDVASGQDEMVDAAALALGYRHSNVAPAQIVVAAEFRLTAGDAEAALSEVSEIVRWRRANQPGGQNAGSVFVNPSGDSAGRLVEAAGCKGMRLGAAEVSTKHANFIQSAPGAAAADVAGLIDTVRSRVRASTGVDLVPEVRFLGFETTGPQP